MFWFVVNRIVIVALTILPMSTVACPRIVNLVPQKLLIDAYRVFFIVKRNALKDVVIGDDIVSTCLFRTMMRRVPQAKVTQLNGYKRYITGRFLLYAFFNNREGIVHGVNQFERLFKDINFVYMYNNEVLVPEFNCLQLNEKK